MRPVASLALPFVAAVVLTACGTTAPVSCQVDGECPTGSACVAGLCQASVVLELTSPKAATTATNGTVSVKVSVAGGDPSTLDVLRDGAPLVKLGPPFEYAWDTSREAEGTYRLVARVVVGERTYESPAKYVMVDRTAPVPPRIGGPRAVSAAPVRVTGTAEPGATLIVSTVAAEAVVAADASGNWAADLDVPPGAHTVTATATDAAGNASAPSAPALLTVDGTRPRIVSREPAIGATDYEVATPIRVTFSKPIAAATVSATSVAVVAHGQALVVDRRLSSDRRTLELRPVSTPVLPAELTVALTTELQDDVGNPLFVEPGTWIFTAPAWISMTTIDAIYAGPTAGAELSALALDRSGRIYVTMTEFTLGTGLFHRVLNWSGSEWVQLGGTFYLSYEPALTVGFDQMPIFAQAEPRNAEPGGNEISVFRWTGSTWVELGDVQLGESYARRPYRPCIGIDSSGAVLVAWTNGHATDISDAGTIVVKRWDGTAWTLLGDRVSVDRTMTPVALALDGTLPYIAFETDTDTTGGLSAHIRVMALSDGGWRNLGEPVYGTSPTMPSLATMNGNPVLAFLDGVAVGTGVPVGTARATIWTGSSWRDLGAFSRAESGPPVVAAASGAAVFAWHEANTFSASQWADAAWVAFGAPGIGIRRQTPRLVIGSNGAPVLAWTECTDRCRGYVRRYNR
jgi:hypothetical protein